MKNINRLHLCKTTAAKKIIEGIAESLPEGKIVRVLRETKERVELRIQEGAKGAFPSNYIPKGVEREGRTLYVLLTKAEKKKAPAKKKAPKKEPEE